LQVGIVIHFNRSQALLLVIEPFSF
jgi:hypothetical protein